MSNAVIARPYTGINDSDPKYRCCCNAMHVRVGAIIIGVLELLGAVSNLGGASSAAASGRSNFNGIQGGPYYGIGSAIVLVIVVTLLFIAIAKENAALVIPHLVVQILAIIGLIIFAICMIILFAIGSYHVSTSESGTHFTVLVIVLVVVFIISAILEIWFFVVILKLYRYYKEKSATAYVPVVQFQQKV